MSINISGSTVSGVVNTGRISGTAPILEREESWEKDELRIAYGVDLVGYRAIGDTNFGTAQQQLLRINQASLAAIGLQDDQVLLQPTGDGFMAVFRNPNVDASALSRFLVCWRALVGEGLIVNERRVRVRMAVGVGCTRQTDLGFSGAILIDVATVLDSEALRENAANRPLAIAVGDAVHDLLGQLGEAASRLSWQPHVILAKDGREVRAWIWDADA